MGCPEKLLVRLERAFSGKAQLSCAAHTTQHFGSHKYEQLQNRSWRKDPVITVKVNSLDATLISEQLSHLLPGTGQISSTAGLLQTGAFHIQYAFKFIHGTAVVFLGEISQEILPSSFPRKVHQKRLCSYKHFSFNKTGSFHPGEKNQNIQPILTLRVAIFS